MNDLSSDVPKTPGILTNAELPAQNEPSAPPQPTEQNQQSLPTNGRPEQNNQVDARTTANRANSLKSTGAKTPEGREASARNALKHRLFAADLTKYFRSDEESQRYQRFVDGIVNDLKPVGDYETILARRAADIQFRLDMLRTAELKVYGGAALLSDTMENYLWVLKDPLRIASLYDMRFQSTFTKTMDELRKAQKTRRDQEMHALEELKSTALSHIQQNTIFDPAKFGFVISRDLVFNKAHLASVQKLASFATGNGVVEKKVVDYVARLPKKPA